MTKPPYLALDIGLKRTGVAISENGMLSRALTTLQADPPHLTQVVQQIIDLVKEWEIATLIVGMPYAADQAPTEQSGKVGRIIRQIEEALEQAGLHPAVVEVDESFTSQDAALEGSGDDLDAEAAALMLQDYLDTNHAA